MKTVSVKDFGSVITDKEVGAKILQLAADELKVNGQVAIDLADVLTMATYCAKQIFGTLYLELGSESFFKKVFIANASDDVKALIQLGILNALELD